MSSGYANVQVNITNGEWAPYTSETLDNYGVVSHIVSAAFAEAGIEVTYAFFPWKRAYMYAENGEGAGLVWQGSIAWSPTPARQASFYFSDAVIEADEVLFFLKTRYIEWEAIEDLNGLSIGGTLHTSYPILEQAAQKKRLILDRAGNYDILFERLLKGRIDAVPILQEVGDFYINHTLSPLHKSLIAPSNTVIHRYSYHLILTKKNAANAELMKRFNAGLSTLRNNGRYQQMIETHRAHRYPIKEVK